MPVLQLVRDIRNGVISGYHPSAITGTLSPIERIQRWLASCSIGCGNWVPGAFPQCLIPGARHASCPPTSPATQLRHGVRMTATCTPGLPADITGSPNGGIRCTPEVPGLKCRLKLLSIPQVGFQVGMVLSQCCPGHIGNRLSRFGTQDFSYPFFLFIPGHCTSLLLNTHD